MSNIGIKSSVETFKISSRFARKNDFDLELGFGRPEILDEAEDYVQAYKNKQQLSLIQSVHGPYMDIYVSSPDEVIANTAKERILQGVKVADQLKANRIVLHTNWLPMITHTQYTQNWVDSHALFWQSVTEDFNLDPVLENMWDTTPNHVKSLMEKLDGKLRACFDTGHFNVFSEASLEKWFVELGQHIDHLHFNDNNGDVDKHMPVGAEAFDWQFLTKLISKHCDSPKVIVELKDLEKVKSSLTYMRENQVYPFN